MRRERRRAGTALAGWFRSDVDRAFAAIVCTILGAIALAGSATHVLHVGAYPEVGVSGWMVWTVAGSLEVLAAYSAWEMRRRSGWNRFIPAVVLLLAVAFIVLANLAAADEESWAAGLPWAQAFAVAPPVSFLSVAAIAETREWRQAGRRVRTSIPKAKGQAGEVQPGSPEAKSVTASGLTVGKDEHRTGTVLRWIAEGRDRKVILTEGASLLGVSESTMRRELRGVDITEGSVASGHAGSVPSTAE